MKNGFEFGAFGSGSVRFPSLVHVLWTCISNRYPKLALKSYGHTEIKSREGAKKTWLDGIRITQHDDPGNHTDCTKSSNLEKDPEGDAVACL